MNHRAFVCMILSFLSLCVAGCVGSPPSQGWITLFDGSNLNHWNRTGEANWSIAEGAVTADKGDAGINVVKSELVVVAEGLTGIDAAAFDALVKDAKMKCPISKALNPSIEITVATSVK